jgi:hypothetical protein
MQAKPCPICKQKPKITYIPDDWYPFYIIECSTKSCNYPEYFQEDDEKQVILKWNKQITKGK